MLLPAALEMIPELRVLWTVRKKSKVPSPEIYRCAALALSGPRVRNSVVWRKPTMKM